MRQEFVLDEGIVICAATHVNPDGGSDLQSDQLIVNIIENGHKFALDNNIYARWSRQISRLQSQREPLVPTVLHLLSSLNFNADVVHYYSPPAGELPGEETWSPKLQDDADFIRLAAQCHGVLSTLDGPLIRDIVQLHLHNDHHFQVATVPESMTLASSPAL